MYTLVIVDDEPAIAKAFAGFLTGNLLALNESGPPEAVLKWYPMWWTGNRMSAWWMYGSAMNLAMN